MSLLSSLTGLGFVFASGFVGLFQFGEFFGYAMASEDVDGNG